MKRTVMKKRYFLTQCILQMVVRTHSCLCQRNSMQLWDIMDFAFDCYSVILELKSTKHLLQYQTPINSLVYRLHHSPQAEADSLQLYIPNQACWSPCTSMARPKSASLTAAPLALLASSRFSGWTERTGSSRHCTTCIKKLCNWAVNIIVGTAVKYSTYAFK